MKKRKYEYTESQEDTILGLAEFLSFCVGIVAVTLFSLFFAKVAVILASIITIGLLLSLSYKTARVLNHRRKVSSQDDNIENEGQS